jgi:hypothetical protein
MMARLMRVAVARNSSVEERWAAERDATMRELKALREDVLAAVDRMDVPADVRAAVRSRLDEARFPHRHERALPVTIVRTDSGGIGLDPGFRPGLTWPVEGKRRLLARGRELGVEAVAEHEARVGRARA